MTPADTVMGRTDPFPIPRAAVCAVPVPPRIWALFPIPRLSLPYVRSDKNKGLGFPASLGQQVEASRYHSGDRERLDLRCPCFRVVIRRPNRFCSRRRSAAAMSNRGNGNARLGETGTVLACGDRRRRPGYRERGVGGSGTIGIGASGTQARGKANADSKHRPEDAA